MRGVTSLTSSTINRFKADADRLLLSEAAAKAKEAGMTTTALLRALLRGYRDGKIQVEVPAVLVNEPEVK